MRDNQRFPRLAFSSDRKANTVTNGHQSTHPEGEYASVDTESALSPGQGAVGCGQEHEPRPSGRRSVLSIVAGRDVERDTIVGQARRGAGEPLLQCLDRQVHASALRQGEQPPLGAVGPSTPTPVGNSLRRDTQRSANRHRTAKIIDQVHTATNVTYRFIEQEQNVSCKLPAALHNVCMAKDERTPFDMEAGRRLAAARRALGLTQETLASALAVSRGTIGNYERGSRGLDLELMGRLKSKYRITSDYLLFGDLYGLPSEIVEQLNADEPRRAG